MDSFSIAISGLDVAKKAIDTIGNNVANAATPGYHRQRINLTPAYTSQVGSVLLGGGVNFEGVTRLINNLLEQEILRQQSSLGQISSELSALSTVENAFGELSTGEGLNTIIDNFFNALQDLSAHPVDTIWQNQTVTAAETMAGQFRILGEFLSTLESEIKLEAENIIDQVNSLTSSIAELNANIQRTEITGGQANNLHDQRDQYITELSELIGVQTLAREFGVVDVSIGGITVVMGASVSELEVGLDSSNSLGISVAGAYNYITDMQGGKLGGLLSLTNDTLAEIHNDLDDLALAIIQQINQYHVQGVGSDGSFTELTGWWMESEILDDFDPPVSDGNIYIRVTNTSTGVITRTAVPVDVSADSLSDIATAIDAITGLSASVTDSKLRIQADTNYKFDFLPAVLPEPETTDIDFNGTSDPTVSVSGIYTGSSNDTFTFTVSGTDDIGNGTLTLTVTNGAAETVTTFNIGSGYAAGDLLDVGNGIKIALSTGDLVAGDSFSIDAFASTDTSGVLAAVGINTFFSGSSAEDMAVCSDISNSPSRVATALGADMTDNANALRMVGLKGESVSILGNITPGEFYRRLVADIGQEIFIKQMRQDSIEVVVQNLLNQQSELSGVNINNEAAQMLVFEQMFQAMARYLNIVQSSIESIMDVV
jgi:flagellar hook-associated protein 1 FlgK